MHLIRGKYLKLGMYTQTVRCKQIQNCLLSLDKPVFMLQYIIKYLENIFFQLNIIMFEGSNVFFIHSIYIILLLRLLYT